MRLLYVCHIFLKCSFLQESPLQLYLTCHLQK
nr:MAG TPA: cysteine-rich protein [Caudoviricetes sp.]